MTVKLTATESIRLARIADSAFHRVCGSDMAFVLEILERYMRAA
jgi:hypothetical protein